ncbi:hypothetical protein XBKQ1_2640017 [Xenorhabdus bovienii str. kraussei Quebec]|uniref:Transposase n=1 Tax=Xenorhabdus bovienii str. kraussei Quebec TaxID=1398203 RepID=A0A077PIL8_XENBV|nr:hypothetical protein XBKQ1_2640017 [Xenorhabdus bovienii str. kraussei Quebec]
MIYSFLLPNFRLEELELVYNILKSFYGEEGRNDPSYYFMLTVGIMMITLLFTVLK